MIDKNYIFLQFLFSENIVNWPLKTNEKVKVLGFCILGDNLKFKENLINNLNNLGVNNATSPFITPDSVINGFITNDINLFNICSNKIVVFKDNEDGLVTFVKYINSICNLRKCTNIELAGIAIRTFDSKFFKQYFDRNFYKPKILLNIDGPIEIYKTLGIVPDYFRYMSDNSVYNNKYELIS